MTALYKLKISALESTTFRGHTMGAWDDSPNRSMSKCLRCGAWVQVEIKPAPNSIDIGGPAVAMHCKGDCTA
jgi:hypothetical protein